MMQTEAMKNRLKPARLCGKIGPVGEWIRGHARDIMLVRLWRKMRRRWMVDRWTDVVTCEMKRDSLVDGADVWHANCSAITKGLSHAVNCTMRRGAWCMWTNYCPQLLGTIRCTLRPPPHTQLSIQRIINTMALLSLFWS